MEKNLKAFLDMIAVSEIGKQLLAVSDNGYNVIVGGSFFKASKDGTPDYSDHPRKMVYLPKYKINSSAAGRYQLLGRYFDFYKKQLGLKDFSPDAQDLIAIQQIKECKALNDILAGRFDVAVAKCARIWASLPGAKYKQHTNSLKDLRIAYLNAGGTIA